MPTMLCCAVRTFALLRKGGRGLVLGPSTWGGRCVPVVVRAGVE